MLLPHEDINKTSETAITVEPNIVLRFLLLTENTP